MQELGASKASAMASTTGVSASSLSATTRGKQGKPLSMLCPFLGGYTTNPGRDCSMGTCIWLAIWLAICMIRSICTTFPIVDCPTLGLPRLPHPALLDLQAMVGCILFTAMCMWAGQPTGRGWPHYTPGCTTVGSSSFSLPTKPVYTPGELLMLVALILLTQSLRDFLNVRKCCTPRGLQQQLLPL